MTLNVLIRGFVQGRFEAGASSASPAGGDGGGYDIVHSSLRVEGRKPSLRQRADHLQARDTCEHNAGTQGNAIARTVRQVFPPTDFELSKYFNMLGEKRSEKFTNDESVTN